MVVLLNCITIHANKDFVQHRKLFKKAIKNRISIVLAILTLFTINFEVNGQKKLLDKIADNAKKKAAEATEKAIQKILTEGKAEKEVKKDGNEFLTELFNSKELKQEFGDIDPEILEAQKEIQNEILNMFDERVELIFSNQVDNNSNENLNSKIHFRNILRDSPKNSGLDEFDVFDMFDINLNTYERFPFFYKDGHNYSMPLQRQELDNLGYAALTPFKNKKGESASIRYFDKNLNLLGKNKYLPYFNGKQRILVSTPNTYNFDKTIKFESEFIPFDRFSFEVQNKGKVLGVNGPFSWGMTKLDKSFINLEGYEVLTEKPSIEFKQHYPTNGNILIKEYLIEGENKNSLGFNFMNLKGDLVLKNNVYFAKKFSEGLAEVCEREDSQSYEQHKKCGFINQQGEIVIPLKYYQTESFQYGYALVNEIVSKSTKTDWKGVFNYVPGVETKKTTVLKEQYYIDKHGSKVFSISEDFKVYPLEKWFVYQKTNSKTVNDSKVGILSKNEKEILSFNNGEMIIYQGDPNDNILIIKNLKTHKTVILLENGELIPIPNYNFVKGFHNGMAIVRKDLDPSCGFVIKNDEKLTRSYCPDQEGFINLKGELQIPYIYRHVSNYAQDRALVLKNDNLFDLINKEGKSVNNNKILNSK